MYGNSPAMMRMKEKEDQLRLERMNTKQKSGTPTRDLPLQTKVFHWMMRLLNEKPNWKQDYDLWIKDGTILIKVLQCHMFNSVPHDMILPKLGMSSPEERVRALQKYLREYGVPEDVLFTEEDLLHLKNIPKVTQCIAMLGRMAKVDTFFDDAPMTESELSLLPPSRRYSELGPAMSPEEREQILREVLAEEERQRNSQATPTTATNNGLDEAHK